MATGPKQVGATSWLSMKQRMRLPLLETAWSHDHRLSTGREDSDRPVQVEGVRSRRIKWLAPFWIVPSPHPRALEKLFRALDRGDVHRLIAGHDTSIFKL